MHDLAIHWIHTVLAALTPSNSPHSPGASGGGGSDNTVKVAIVTTLGVVVAAGITALASTFQRERTPRSTVPANDNFTRDYITGLVTDQRKYRKLQVEYFALREACVKRDLDPDDLIREHQEQHP